MDVTRGLTRNLRSFMRRFFVAENRANRVQVLNSDENFGIGGEWSRRVYGEFYATVGMLQAAIRVRSEAISRPPVLVEELRSDGWKPVKGPNPLTQLLDKPNPFMTGTLFWRTVETDLQLFGQAFVSIEKAEGGGFELWPLRPYNVKVLPSKADFVKGYVYEESGGRVAYLPDEVLWFRYGNPLNDWAGLAPAAAVRTVLEGIVEAERYNRNFFKNAAMPGDLVIKTQVDPTEQEVADFYERWEKRFMGSARSHRPALLNKGMDLTRIGLTQKDMEFIAALKWGVEEVSRVTGVPKAFLSDLTEATFANINAEERFFWRNTMVAEMLLLAGEVGRVLVPRFGDPSKMRVRWDLSVIEALQEGLVEKAERLAALLTAGVLTANEVRKELGYDTAVGGDVLAPVGGQPPAAEKPGELGPRASNPSAAVVLNGRKA